LSDTIDYHSRINRDLLVRIPRQANVIVEVGCGTGALGAAFKATHPQAYYVGIESDVAAADRARAVLDQVICADVESTGLPLADLPPLDCLIYGDVLEHLRDPWSCLQRHALLLKPQGTLLACIPNVQHWSVIFMLLRGEWPLADEGLFDRTHLRWFTRSGITNLMQQAGLAIQEIQPRIFDPAQARAFVEALLPALPQLGLHPKALLAGTAPLQYVVVATRS
jgi:SAM-dependent methyltransferase